MALSDSGLLARYYMDEAASGQTPTELVDSSGVGVALNVPITYGNSLSWAEVSGNRCLRSSGSAGTGVATTAALTSGNKIFDALDGATEATLEYVINALTYNGSGSRVFGLMNGTGGNGTLLLTGSATVLNGSGTNSEVRVNNTNYSDNNGDLGDIFGRSVVHVVLDTTQAAQDDRIRVYVNGVEQAKNASTFLSLNQTLNFADTRLVFHNRGAQNRAFEGDLFYAAIYDEAFDQTRVTAHQTQLSTDDDTPASTGFDLGSADVNSTSTASPELGLSIEVETSSDAVSVIASTLDGGPGLEASLVTDATIVADLDGGPGLSADIDSISALSADLDIPATGLELGPATIAAESAVNSALDANPGLSAPVSAVSGDSLSMAFDIGLSATDDSLSGLSVDLTANPGLSADVDAVSSLVAALTVGSDFETIITSTSSVSSELSLSMGLGSQDDSISSIAADLIFEGGFALNATIAAASNAINAALDLRNALSAALTSEAAITPDLGIESKLETSIDSVSGVSANLLTGGNVDLDAAIQAVSSVSASLDLRPGLQASLLPVAGVSADLLVDPGLIASVDSASTLTADLTVNPALAINVNAVSMLTADLGGASATEKGFLNGTVDIVPALGLTVTLTPALSASVSVAPDN